MVTPGPGDFELIDMAGNTGELIHVLQILNGDGFGHYEHAAIYAGGKDNAIIEANPAGVQVGSLAEYAGRNTLWSTGRIQLTEAQRAAIVAAAYGYLGVPYGWPDYGALAAHRFHVPLPGLKGYMASPRHMICSQLVDQCYADAGVQLFNDKRWPGYVTPGDLDQLLEKGRR